MFTVGTANLQVWDGFFQGGIKAEKTFGKKNPLEGASFSPPPCHNRAAPPETNKKVCSQNIRMNVFPKTKGMRRF